MVEEARSSNRTLIIVLAAGALCLAFVVLAAVVILVMGQGSDSEEGVTAEAAKLMPPDTMMFFSMNPDLPAAENFDVIRNAWGDVPGFDKVVDNWPAVLFEEVEELSYETDIEPWLGDELAISIEGDLFAGLSSSIDQTFAEIESALSGELPQSPPISEMPEIPQIVIAIATKDTAASDEFLDMLRAEAERDVTLQETSYKDIQVVYHEAEYEGDTGIAYATVDDFIVLAVGDLETIEAVIDAKDGDNLADDEAYKDVVAALPKGSVGFAYVDAGRMMETLAGSMEEMYASMGMAELGTLGATGLDQAKAVRGVGFSFGFDPEGMRFDVVSVYDKDALPEDMPSATTPNKAAQHVPADTLLYFSSVDLGSVFKGLLDLAGAMAQPEMGMGDLQESLDMLESQLGFKVDDLYEALSGEYSLAVTYETAGLMGDPSAPIGLVVQFENKDEEVFKQLMSLAGLMLMSAPDIEMDTTTINDVSVTTIGAPTGETMVGWGLSGDFFALATSQGLLEVAFGGGDTLADDATFKAAGKPLPKKANSYFYMNVAEGLDVIYQAMSPYEQSDFEEARPILEPIKAISGAGEPASRDKDSAVATFFILLED